MRGAAVPKGSGGPATALRITAMREPGTGLLRVSGAWAAVAGEGEEAAAAAAADGRGEDDHGVTLRLWMMHVQQCSPVSRPSSYHWARGQVALAAARRTTAPGLTCSRHLPLQLTASPCLRCTRLPRLPPQPLHPWPAPAPGPSVLPEHARALLHRPPPAGTARLPRTTFSSRKGARRRYRPPHQSLLPVYMHAAAAPIFPPSPYLPARQLGRHRRPLSAGEAAPHTWRQHPRTPAAINEEGQAGRHRGKAGSAPGGGGAPLRQPMMPAYLAPRPWRNASPRPQ